MDKRRDGAGRRECDVFAMLIDQLVNSAVGLVPLINDLAACTANAILGKSLIGQGVAAAAPYGVLVYLY